MKIITRLLMLCFFLTGGISSVYGDVVDQIVAVVNKKVITRVQLQQTARQLRAQGETQPDTEDAWQEKVLNFMIENELIHHKAEDSGILVNDEELNAALYDIKQRYNIVSDDQLKEAILQEGRTWEDFLQEIRGQIKIAKLVNREVRSQIEIRDAEVELYYQTHADEFEQESPTVHIRHILLKTDPNASETERAQVQERAAQIVQQLRGGANFADMARQYSEHASAESGGELGFFKEGDLAAPFDIAFSMESGAISEPVRSELGFHIVYVEEKVGGEHTTFDKAKQAIRRKLFEEKSNVLYQKWLKELKEEAYIEIR